MSSNVIAVDVGGTFIDVVPIDRETSARVGGRAQRPVGGGGGYGAPGDAPT